MFCRKSAVGKDLCEDGLDVEVKFPAIKCDRVLELTGYEELAG